MDAKVKEIKERFSISELTGQILARRFSSLDEIEKKIFPLQENGLFQEEFSEEISRLKNRLKKAKRVLLYVDSDADGLLSFELLKRALSLYPAELFITSNERKEGYGLLEKRVRAIEKLKPDLVLTADLGSDEQSFSFIERVQEKGIDVFVTDHHPFSERPPSVGFINPAASEKEELRVLSGAAVIYKVFREELSERPEAKIFVALSLVADHCPAIFENRLFVRDVFFREEIKRAWPKWLSLSPPQSVSEMGFQVVPKINSIGRMGRLSEWLREKSSASEELKLQYLTALNEERKRRQNDALSLAKALVRGQKRFPVTVVSLPEDFLGLMGLVASRLASELEKPVLVGTDAEDGFKGSFRDFTARAALREVFFRFREELSLVRVGGHLRAGGFHFSISSEEVLEKLSRVYEAFLLEAEPAAEEREVDLEFSPKDFLEKSGQILRAADELFPFGEGNPPIRVLLSSARDFIVNDGSRFWFQAGPIRFRVFDKRAVDALLSAKEVIVEISDRKPPFEIKTSD